MPAYNYTAIDAEGKKYKGQTEAPDEAQLQLRLKNNGQFLKTCRTVQPKSGRPLKPAALADFSRQIGSLVGAGISLVRALTILSEEEGLKPRQKELYVALNREVQRGVPLSQAMQMQGDVFPVLLINMFRSAEASGSLEATAKKMADHYDKDSRLAARVKSSMTYPKILAGLIVVVVTIIMGFVMPKFSNLFAQMHSLPLSTRILFAISHFVVNDWWLLIIIIVFAVLLIRVMFKAPTIRKFLDKLLLRVPKIGSLMRVIYTARFARTLSSMYSCGLSIVSALQISRDIVGNSYIESQFDVLISFVRGGHSLSEGLARVDGFSKKLSSTARVGEESGNLEELLSNMADEFDYEAEQSLNKLVSYLEPVMIVIMAIIVAFIMYAVIMPIYNSYSTIGYK